MKIMGILNVTPDSFSDGNDFFKPEEAWKRAMQVLEEGADILDIGGESTRPGHQRITDQEEIQRILPILEGLQNYPLPISIDTYKSRVAAMALEAGACIINDIWGFQADPLMAELAASGQYLSVLMHNQQGTEYEEDILDAMKRFFAKSIELALQAGLKDDKIILDPGIGFGKTFQHNWEVLGRIGELKSLGYPLLLGTSRKGFLGDLLQVQAKGRDVATLTTSFYGWQEGVEYFRVHDVQSHVQAKKVLERIQDVSVDR